MTEDDAQGWIREHYGLEARDRLGQFVALVGEENNRQNLISRGSLAMIWTRHVFDSIQLVRLVGDGAWLDIGSGAGFPGLAVACIRPANMMLVEPRPLRAAFLERASKTLALANVTVAPTKVGMLKAIHPVVSARAVAPLDQLFAMAHGVSNADTQFVFPRGRNARIEVAEVQQHWRGVFHVEQSLSDPNAAIIVAQGVHRR